MKSNFGAPKMPSLTERQKMPRGMRFDLIHPLHLSLILAIADRVSKAAMQWRLLNVKDQTIEVNPTVIQVDLAITHLCRNLDLAAFLNAPLLEFFAEHATIQKNIDRGLHLMPDDVKLRFAHQGAKLNH